MATKQKSEVFRDWVRERRAAQGLTDDKALATALHDTLTERGENDLGYATVVQKLSKLLNGHAEGQQLIDGAVRLNAFAEVLGVTREDVEKKLAARDERITLVLDPALSKEAQDYFRRRADEPNAAFAVRSPAVASPAELHRCAAEVEGRPVIVLANEADEVKFEVTGHAVTTAWRAKRGWVLGGAFAELVPEPPRAAPPTHDADGRRLFPLAPTHELVTQALRNRRAGYGWQGPAAVKNLDALVSADEWVPVSLVEALGAVVRERGVSLDPQYGDRPWARHVEQPRSDLAAQWLEQREVRETEVWFVGDRMFGTGPAVARLTELFGPYHPEVGVHPLRLPADLERALAGRNPRRIAGSERWEAIRQAYLAETLVDLASWLPLYIARRESIVDKLPVRKLVDDEDAAVRRAIHGIARRTFSGADDLMTMPFRLDALAAAPLVAIEVEAKDTIAVIGNLGAGRLLQLVLQTYADEAPTDVVSVQHKALDGGDFRAWLTPRYDELLEGIASPARERRRRAAEEDDSYDDD